MYNLDLTDIFTMFTNVSDSISFGLSKDKDEMTDNEETFCDFLEIVTLTIPYYTILNTCEGKLMQLLNGLIRIVAQIMHIHDPPRVVWSMNMHQFR